MKAVCFVLVIFSSILSVKAQVYHPLVDTNKVWSTAHYYGTYPTPSGSDFIKFQGDVIIDGKIYKQVWKCTDTTQTNWDPDGYIREDSDRRVYYLTWTGGSPNNLIYDFGVGEGDTVFLFADPMGFYQVVDSIGFFQFLNGETRKSIHLTCYDPQGVPLWGNDTWIEGMGSLYGILQSGTCMLVGDNPQLICFTENDTLKYMNPEYESCYVITGIRKNKNEGDWVTLFPNPSSGSVTLRINQPVQKDLVLEILDPAGRILQKIPLRETETTIDPGFLRLLPGVYLLRVEEDATGKTETNRLVIY